MDYILYEPQPPDRPNWPAYADEIGYMKFSTKIDMQQAKVLLEFLWVVDYKSFRSVMEKHKVRK